MDFLLDVHLPISLSKVLDQQGNCSCTHVNQILQKWHTPDDVISKYADENNLVLITKDNDFKDSHFINKTPLRLIRVTLGNISSQELTNLFLKFLPFILSSVKPLFYIELGRDQLTVID